MDGGLVGSDKARQAPAGPSRASAANTGGSDGGGLGEVSAAHGQGGSKGILKTLGSKEPGPDKHVRFGPNTVNSYELTEEERSGKQGSKDRQNMLSRLGPRGEAGLFKQQLDVEAKEATGSGSGAQELKREILTQLSKDGMYGVNTQVHPTSKGGNQDGSHLSKEGVKRMAEREHGPGGFMTKEGRQMAKAKRELLESARKMSVTGAGGGNKASSTKESDGDSDGDDSGSDTTAL